MNYNNNNPCSKKPLQLKTAKICLADEINITTSKILYRQPDRTTNTPQIYT